MSRTRTHAPRWAAPVTLYGDDMGGLIYADVAHESCGVVRFFWSAGQAAAHEVAAELNRATSRWNAILDTLAPVPEQHDAVAGTGIAVNLACDERILCAAALDPLVERPLSLDLVPAVSHSPRA